MTTQNPNTNSLNITKDDVIDIITCIIDVDGLEEAKSVFKQLNAVFSTLPGWKETAAEIYRLFADKRKEEKQQMREEKLEELRAAASSVLVLSQATSDASNIGRADVDMKVDVNTPGNNIARIIKFSKEDED